jgi:myo-inositol 2-dehydrogenase / D-chiro-inositol 1-dehydrogenase
MGVRVALVGAGTMGSQHARNLAALDGVDELLIADAIPELAERLATELGATACRTPEEAVERVDALAIAAATDAHAALVDLGIDRGIPVFCEKPLALDLPETIRLVDRSESTGATVMVGFQRRHDPAYAEARRLVESGELGVLYLIKLHAHDHEPPPDHYVPVSGGMFRDSSIHDFDLVRWLSGQEVDEVYAVGSVRNFEIFARHDDIDTAAATLTLTDGTVAILGQTRHDPIGYDIRTELIGSKDSVVVGLDDRTPQRSLEAGMPAPTRPYVGFLDRFGGAYRNEMAAFLRVVTEGLPSPCTARDGLEAMRIAVAATRSRSEGRPVRLATIDSA